MKKFARNILRFAFVFVAQFSIYVMFCYFILPQQLKKIYGPTTENQVVSSFENAVSNDYDLLILGNSRCYRGINPALLDVPSYNFSHDNDSYNQMYYKLLYLEQKGIEVDEVIVGVDMFLFSYISGTRNYIYNRYFDCKYQEDYNKFKEFFIHFGRTIDPEVFKMWLHGMSKKADSGKLPYLKNNGQYIYPGIATTNDSIKRDCKRLFLQEDYFKKIISWAKNNNKKIFVVQPPVRDAEWVNYTNEQIIDFNKFIESFVDNVNVFYLDFSRTADFGIDKFSDITHLNEYGADCFTAILNDSINNLLNK